MFNLIVAYDKNRVIGNGGKMPWRIPGEQKRFKELTMGHTVIMGRVTFEEIGHALPGRKTIVVSSTKSYDEEGIVTVRSFFDALDLIGNDEQVFIAGGERIYHQALLMLHISFIYATEIETEVDGGDRFFPEIDATNFEKIDSKSINGKLPYTYVTYKNREPEPVVLDYEEFVRTMNVKVVGLPEMHLTDEPFKQIISGEKTIEVRLYDDKRRQLHVGDEIQFIGFKDVSKHFRATIVALHKASSFKELFSNTKIYNECGFGEATVDEAIEMMRQYYTAEQEERFGVLGIEFGNLII